MENPTHQAQRFLKAAALIAAVAVTVGCSSAPEQSGVFVTKDAGLEWVAAPDLSAAKAKAPDIYPPLEVTAVAVNPADPNVVLAGTGDELFRTTDGGKNWEALAEKLPAAKGKAVAVQEIVWDPSSAGTFYVTGVTSGYGKVLKGTDRGNTLKEIFTVADPKTSTTALLLDPRNPTTLYVGDEAGSVYKSVDAGASWQRIFSTPQPVSSLVTSGDSLFAGTVGDGIFRSDNAGASWRPTGGLEGHQRTVWRLSAGLGGIYAGTDEGLFVTRNGGGNWNRVGRPLPAGEDRIQALTIAGPNLYYATNAVVYRSPGGGESFVPAQLRLATNVFSLSASAKEPGVLYAGAGGSKLSFTDRYGNNALSGTKLAPPGLER